MSFSAFLTASNTCFYMYRAQLNIKMILILVIASSWQNLHHISISFLVFGCALYKPSIGSCQKWQNSIVLLILLNLNPNKSPFNQHYHKPVPNPDILIISLPKNDKMLMLAKISFFLTIFPIFSMEISYIKMLLWDRLSTSDMFSNLNAIACFNLYFVICMR